MLVVAISELKGLSNIILGELLQQFLVNKYFNIGLFLCVCERDVHECVEVRRQLIGVSSLLSACRFRELCSHYETDLAPSAFCFFETVSLCSPYHPDISYVSHAGLELVVILLPQPPKGWDCKHESLYWIEYVF